MQERKYTLGGTQMTNTWAVTFFVQVCYADKASCMKIIFLLII